MGSEESWRWSVYDEIKTIPSNPEALMADIDSAIAKLENGRATAVLDPPTPSTSPSSTQLKVKSPDLSSDSHDQYDVRMADEAYRAGCAALAAGKLDEALHSLNISLANCPPHKTSAVVKLRSLISLATHKLQRLPT